MIIKNKDLYKDHKCMWPWYWIGYLGSIAEQYSTLMAWLQRLPHMLNWTCVCWGDLQIDLHCVVQRSNFDTLTKVVAGAFFALCAGVTIADDYSTNRHEVDWNPQWEFLIIMKTHINENKHRSKVNVQIKNIQRSTKFNYNKKWEILC